MTYAGRKPLSTRIISLFMAVILSFSYYPVTRFVEEASARSMSPTEHAAGSAPYDVTIGDLNNDGRNDVAVANFKAGNVGVYYQDVSGNLGAMSTLPVPPADYRGGYKGNPYSVKIIDFDGDGLNDLVATNEFHHQAWLYRQDAGNSLYLWQIGTGIETSGAHPYSNPYGVDVGDLNMDDTTDIATAIFEDTMNPADPGSIGTFANLVPDLTSVNFLNSQKGFITGWHGLYRTFTGGVNPDTAPTVTSLWESLYVPIDDSKDSNAYITDVSSGGGNYLWAVGTKGYVVKSSTLGSTWGVPVTIPVPGSDLYGVSAAGNNSAVVVGEGGLVMRIKDGATFTNDSTEGVTNNLFDVENMGSRSWVVGSGGLIAVWDYSGDSAVQVVQDSGTPNRLNDLSVFGSKAWAVGSGGTIVASSDVGTDAATWTPQASGVVENLNGVDFVSAARGWAVGAAGTIITTTDGGATWTSQASGTTYDLNDVDFSDANNGKAVGDGGTILITSDGGSTWVDASTGNQTLGLGNHTVTPMQNFPMTQSAKNPYALKIADANNDGKADMTVAAWSTSNVTNYRIGWNGDGLFWDNDTRQEVASGINPSAIVPIDYNADGRDDLATANYTDNSVSILTQPVIPANGFASAATLLAGQSPAGIAAGDLNGDTFEDLAVSNADSNSISVFTKQAATGPYNLAANFSSSTSYSGQPYGLAIGDVDGDGVSEIVAAISSPLNGNKIDVFKLSDRPGAPGVTSSTHPDSSVYYLSNKPQFSITSPADVDGISGYYWVIDQSPTTVPTTDTPSKWSASGTVNILSGLTPDGDYYFHAVAKDSKGNVGSAASEVAHYAFKINSTPLITTIQSPGEGATVGGTINVDTTATTSSLFTVDKVEIFVDDAATPNAVLTSAPYRYVWDTGTVSDGQHTIKAIAYDSGNRQSSDTNAVTVDNSSIGGSASGVTRSSLVLNGSQFQVPGANVIGMDYYEQSNDTWKSVGYYAGDSASASGIYDFNLPSPSTYLWQKLTINEDAGKAQGAAARYYAYNWSTNAWDKISASQELSFWHVDNTNNKVRVRVIAPSWSVHQIESLSLEYKYAADSAAPAVSALQASAVNFASDYYSRVSFGLSESAYVEATIRNGSGTLVRTMNLAKSAGLPAFYWNLKNDAGNLVTPGDYTVTVKATDLAGNTFTTAPAPITQVVAGSKTWYFAEGATSSSQDTYVTLYNAGPRNTQARIDYMLDTGAHSRKNYAVSARSFTKIKLNSAIGNRRVFGMKIVSNDPIVAERSSYVSSDGHSTIGTTGTSQHWYFADGSTAGGTRERVALLNPSGSNAAVKMTYMFTNGTSLTRAFTLSGGRRRTTINAARVVGTGKNFALHVETTNGVGIVAERSLGFTYRGWSGNSVSLGAKSPAGAWYFAAGSTGSSNDEYLVVQNPGASSASVRVKYMLESGAAITKTHSLGVGKRLSLKVNSYVGNGKNVGIKVTSTQPVIAERSEYFSSGGVDGGYGGIGATALGKTWYLPQGDTTSGNTDRVAIVNPGSTAANVLLKYREKNRTLTTRSVIVKANSVALFDATVSIGSGKQTALEVISDQDVAAERTLTFNHSGWKGASNTTGHLVQ